jgi:large subunit ribosomal protein L13
MSVTNSQIDRAPNPENPNRLRLRQPHAYMKFSPWVRFKTALLFCVGILRFEREFLLEIEKMSTYIPSAHEIDRKWFVVDASGKTLGRLATEAASVLSGKRNPKYVPYIDMGDHVIVINAEKIRLTGLKSQQKVYRRYTGFPGGLREESFTRLLQRRPEKIVEEAIKGMLPKTKMGRKMGSKLNVYKGDQHPHQAQKPQPLEVKA